MKVGFVGLGIMGAPMARNLLRKGFRLRAYDIDPAKRKALHDAGAQAVDEVAGLAGWADVVVLMLPGPKEIKATALQLREHARRGAVVLDMSTSDPGLDQEMARTLADKGVAWLDAPVSRAVPAAVEGKLLAMVGGDAQVLESGRPVLAAMASDIVHVGPSGCGHAMKLLNNLKIMAEVALMAEVVALGVRSGIPAQTVDKVLASSSADSFMWRYQVPRMVRGDFVPGFSIDHGHKDLTLARLWAERLKTSLAMGPAAIGMFETAQRLGYGALDTAALVNLHNKEL